MKVVFAGPSLAGVDVAGICADVSLRGPARHGDVTRAVLEDAAVIGLIDGLFEAVAAVWHKEILFALSQGVRVFGAASMGALRAAECVSFGMVGVGAVFLRYASGELDDDAAVAQLHGPAELDYAPLTEALVNVEATVANAERLCLVTPIEALELRRQAARIHFKDRTWKTVIETMSRVTPARRAALRAAVLEARIDAKRCDAEEMLRHLAITPDERQRPPDFVLSHTDMLDRTIISSKPI